jgi:hypothetical protein
MEIRGKTISFSSYIKKNRVKKEKELLDELLKLEDDYENHTDTINEKID